ncbi:MAG: hypothetical protein ACRD2N_00780 [Vicinamibacterales bacterium]
MERITATLTRRIPLTGSATETPLNPLRTGMPALDSIQSAAVTLRGTYRVIRTTEVDAYEKSPLVLDLMNLLRAKGVISATVLESILTAKATTGDGFKGAARKAAKTSIADAAMESFSDLKDLVSSLTPDDEMIDRTPKIGVGAGSRRVSEEKRNVRVPAFLYAASRENDNDFHLIIGRDPEASTELYMTMELSGLPSNSAAAFQKLKGARNAYKTFFGSELPGFTYDFYDPPIPVAIEGSLFFDMNHATGTRPGPQSLKSRMPTIWEVHPISKITLGP